LGCQARWRGNFCANFAECDACHLTAEHFSGYD
jgi:hypothetical protein